MTDPTERDELRRFVRQLMPKPTPIEDTDDDGNQIDPMRGLVRRMFHRQGDE